MRLGFRSTRRLALLLLASGAALHAAEDAADFGPVIEQGRPARWFYDQHQKLNAAIAAIKPHQPGVVDAFVVSIGLDADPVFGREAAEAARVLSRRYGATGRTITLSAGPGAGDASVLNGSPANLSVILGGIATKMDPAEDVLILYTTSHGSPDNGLAYRDGVNGVGMIGPKKLADMLDGYGIKRRVAIISACYSGIFVPALRSENSVIVTAASDSTSSFGCVATNDWTYFGDAFINHGLRTPQPLEKAVSAAFGDITRWEKKEALMPSQPQFSMGTKVASWLVPLEARMPKLATKPVGRPSAETSAAAVMGAR